jgi:hypothetical protein
MQAGGSIPAFAGTSLGKLLEHATADVIDRPISFGRKKGEPLAMRLVARKPAQAAEAARRKARAEPRRHGQQLARGARERDAEKCARLSARIPLQTIESRSLS